MFTSLKVNIMVTLLTVVMVFMLPWLDHFICRKLGVSLSDGISTNLDADRLLHIRKILLIIMFCVYLRAVSYVTFFSRSAADDYQLHIALFQDLGDSMYAELVGPYWVDHPELVEKYYNELSILDFDTAFPAHTEHISRKQMFSELKERFLSEL